MFTLTQVILAGIVAVHVANEDGDESGDGGSSDGVVFGLWDMCVRNLVTVFHHRVTWCYGTEHVSRVMQMTRAMVMIYDSFIIYSKYFHIF